ncbi:MAG: glycosyltransferase [Planctomycetia bacterium]|nr:glycosyltransferase [Planctomycetia bacterium]
MEVRDRNLTPPDDRGPLRVMFLITSMPVGGAETLLVNLIRRLNRERFVPSLCCLKSLGPLGEVLAREIPAFHDLINYKYDLGVVRRLANLFLEQRIDAVVTVGAGDKMFWGRLAAHRADVPVVVCALHTTGWPDAIGRLNRLRLLTRWTDAFVGVADAHGRHLNQEERFPSYKVRVIPNGVDANRFHPSQDEGQLRRELGIAPAAPLAGIVAALRPEKNHELLLRAAARVRHQIPHAEFLIIGDGPERPRLEQISRQLGLAQAVHFLGTRADIPELLAALDVFVLTSRIEANPVSILEAMATAKPVIAPRVGSIGESVIDGETGFLTDPLDEQQIADRLIQLLGDPELARRLGQGGREAVLDHWSLERMVQGYENLIAEIYTRKCTALGQLSPAVRPLAAEGDRRAAIGP